LNLQERRQPSWACALNQKANTTYTQNLEILLAHSIRRLQEAHSIPWDQLQVLNCSLNADAIRGKLELQLEFARINCIVATKEAEEAWARLLSNRDNEHHLRQLFFHTVWKIREVVYKLPHRSHGDPQKQSIYDLLSKLLDCDRDKNRYLELWKELDDFRSEQDFEQARRQEDVGP